MTTKDDGGPAFPIPGSYDTQWEHNGMTLRDYFAGRALAGLGANINPHLPGDMASFSTFPDAAELAERRARWAYVQADAMLAARQGGAE